MTQLMVSDNEGLFVPASPETILSAARQLRECCWTPESIKLNQTHLAKDFLSMQLADREVEVFVALFLNNRHRLIAYEELSQGTINQSIVFPREVIRAALHHNAAAVIFAHNHPSGEVDASDEDIKLTKRLSKALQHIDCRVLDHIIIGQQPALSFMESSLL